MQVCLSGWKVGQSHFNHCGSPVKLVQASLNARGDEESIFSLLCRPCEARAGLCKCQERRRKQFSPLCTSCEARARLFWARKDRESNSHNCGGAVKLMQAYLNIRRDRESNFHHCVCAE